MFIAEKIISVIAPHTCMVCSEEGSLVCAWCFPEALPPLPVRCYRCKQASADSAVCERCRRTSKLKHVWVRADYGGLAKKLLYSLKFRRAQAAAVSISALMEEVLPFLSPETIVVPVPTATSRRRQRGYDHAELLARQVAHRHGLRQLPLLARMGQSRQVGTKREERIEQLKQAFRPRKLSLIQGASILLVDDITTTGATLEAAASTLKQAGAKTIYGLTFAQKQ